MTLGLEGRRTSAKATSSAPCRLICLQAEATPVGNEIFSNRQANMSAIVQVASIVLFCRGRCPHGLNDDG